MTKSSEKIVTTTQNNTFTTTLQRERMIFLDHVGDNVNLLMKFTFINPQLGPILKFSHVVDLNGDLTQTL